MIFPSKHDASVYKKCRGTWYDEAHKVIPATVDGKHIGWMLQLKETVRFFQGEGKR